MIVRTLKILGWVTGVSLMVLGAGRIFFPLETIPGAGAVTATLVSTDLDLAADIGRDLAAHLDVRRLEVRIVRHREPRHRQPVLSGLDLLLQLER